MAVLALYIMELTYFPFKQWQIPLEWLSVSGIHLPPDDHILHLVFHITVIVSGLVSLNLSLTSSLSLSDSPSRSLRLFTIPQGALRDPLHCFVWMTLKDNGSLEPWPALSVCESASLHWECCPPMSREVMWSMCDWRGFPPLRVGVSRRGVYIVWMRVCARARCRWNFIESSELKQHIVSVLMWARDSRCRAVILK